MKHWRFIFWMKMFNVLGLKYYWPNAVIPKYMLNGSAPALIFCATNEIADVYAAVDISGLCEAEEVKP